MKQITTRSLPIAGVPHRRHQVLVNGAVIHSQISALDSQGVAMAVARWEQAKRDAADAQQAERASAPTHAVCATRKKRKPIAEFARDWSVRCGHKRDCKPCLKAKRSAE